MLPKSSNRPADIKTLLFDVYRRYRAGLIDDTRAREEARLLTACLEAVAEADEIERLERIREVLRAG